VQISPTRERYTRYTRAFLIDPDRPELAGYVGWWMQRRMEAYGAFAQACQGQRDKGYLDFACARMEDALSVRYPPWPWDLESTVALEEYLVATARG
jgi:hypothetical protein